MLLVLVRAVATAVALTAVSLVVGCSSGEDADPDRSWEPEVNAGKDPSKKGGSTCAPQTCSSAGKTCGTHDDGCGGQIDCGKCVDAQCTPKTCQQLTKTCGKVDDECGGVVDCGVCATCAADAKAGNSSADKANDLGQATDTPATDKKVAELSLGENEEDWFKVKVTDAGFGGNPYLKASVAGAPVDVSVFYLCDSQTNYSTCPVQGETVDNNVGMGCTGKGTASLYTNCNGTTESGTAFIRVRKTPGVKETCLNYTLDLHVEQHLW